MRPARSWKGLFAKFGCQPLAGIAYPEGFESGRVREEGVGFLVDPGAAYKALRRGLWERLGPEPKRAVEAIGAPPRGGTS